MKNNCSHPEASTVTKEANKTPVSTEMKANMPRVCLPSSRDLQGGKVSGLQLWGIFQACTSQKAPCTSVSGTQIQDCACEEAHRLLQKGSHRSEQTIQEDHRALTGNGEGGTICTAGGPFQLELSGSYFNKGNDQN